MTERILVVGSFSHSLVNFRGPLFRCLRERGHQVLAAAPNDEHAGEVREALGAMGIVLHTVPIARGSTNPVGDMTVLRALRRLIRKQRPTVVIAYTAKPVIYAGLAVRREAGIRFFPMITGLGYAFTEGRGLKRRVIRGVVRRLYRKGLAAAEIVIFQNPDDQTLFHELGVVPAHVRTERVCGSGVDRTAFPMAPLPDEPVFLMMARLVAYKGVREYIEAARWVRERYPRARFLLAGGLDPNPVGIGKAEVDAWAAEEAIEYLGWVMPVQPVLAQCRYFVLPSYREGVPRSVLEAMSTGRPVITTDAPGCRETVEHRVNGLLVPPGDSEALAAAMFEMLRRSDDEVRSMAEAGLQMVRNRFDVRRVNAHLLRITGL
jgi:glycosyltransferase involved in cell wall biosynthesis